MNNINTNDLDIFLNENNIKYEKKYDKNNNRINYNLQQNFDDFEEINKDDFILYDDIDD